MSEEVKVEETEVEPNLAGVLSAFEGSPSQDQIETWKQKHGDVFCSGFSDAELFVWRSLTRREFVDMQIMLAQSESPVNQYEVEEKVVMQCLLWGSPPGIISLEKKAGSLSTLHEQLLQNSNFLNPAVASQLVFKL